MSAALGPSNGIPGASPRASVGHRAWAVATTPQPKAPDATPAGLTRREVLLTDQRLLHRVGRIQENGVVIIRNLQPPRRMHASTLRRELKVDLSDLQCPYLAICLDLTILSI